MNELPSAPETPHLSQSIAVPLGSNPAEQRPIGTVVAAAEAILREPRRVMYHLHNSSPARLIWAMLLIAAFCGLLYGLVAGTFSGKEQLWAAPVKIVVGLLISGLICLPSLYIFSCLSGSPARLTEVLGFLAALLALSAVLLIGFAPVAWIFSASTESLTAMGALHLGFWIIATSFGLRFLYAAFATLNPKSVVGIRVWALIFVLVQLQMMTAIRPILGRSESFLPTQKKFFVAHWLDCLGNSVRGDARSTARD